MKTEMILIRCLAIIVLLMFGCEETTTNSNGDGDINGIYIADGGNNRIIRMDDMTGAGWETFGSEGNGVGEFIKPSGIAIGPDEKIYVVDSGNNRIVRIDDMNGEGWISYGTGGNGVGEFDFSWDSGSIVVGDDGKIYIADNMNIKLYVQVDNIAEIMADADISLGAGGSTTWERMAVGLPSLVVTLAENQVAFTKELHKKEYINWIGHVDQVNQQTIYGSLLRVIDEVQELYEQSHRGKLLVDGLGVNRVVNEMINYG